VVGHGLALVQSANEIVRGAQAIAGGTGEAVVTAPASATGVGAVLPAVGVGAAVVGTVAVGHGAYVAGNTLNNIFSKNNDGHPDTNNSAQGAQDQAEEINKNQAEQRKSAKVIP
jgi:hypothetical protein